MTSSEYVRLRRARLNDAGMCIDCGRRRQLPTAKRCPFCNRKLLDAHHARKHSVSVGRVSGDGPTLDAIAAELGVSRQRVNQIMATALRKLKRECLRRGIDLSWIVGKPVSMLGRAEEMK